MATVRSKLFIRWTPEGGQEQSIDFDLSSSEGYESAAEVSEHATETGTAIGDNVRSKNRTFSVQAFVSNTPIETPQFGMDGATGDVVSASVVIGGKTITAKTFRYSQPFNRVRAIDEQILALIDAGQRVTVYTGVRKTDNCAISRYRWDRSGENGNDLEITLEFTRIRTATTRTVPAPRQRRGRQEANRGAQPAVEDNRSADARIMDEGNAFLQSHGIAPVTF